MVEVFDLAVLLSMATDAQQQGKVVLVVSLGDRDLGTTVDTVPDTIFASAEQSRPGPASASGAAVSALVNNDERLTAILNLEMLSPATPATTHGRNCSAE